MSQINVNAPEPGDVVGSSGDRSAAAGINLVTVLIVLAVLAVIAWFLFTGPLRSMAGGTTNINVNPVPTTSTTINVNPPSQPNTGQNPAPANQAPANPAPPKP
jgi:HAMP domain-containing protein